MTARPKLRIGPEHNAQSSLAHPEREPALPAGDEDRARRVAEAAYYRAEKRGFAPGWELEDWLAAEREIDALVEAAT
jgi:hypothetical protein